jgi:hypothetical protein
VPRNEGDGGSVLAVRDRDAGVGRGGDPRSDPRHDLERHAGGGESLGFLAAAPEDHRVAALQPHDAAPGPRALDHQPLDLLLRS